MHALQNPIDFIEAGDIGAAVGFKDIKTGDTLCDENTNYPRKYEIPAPVMVLQLSLKPKLM
jgi:elongation factor G